MKKLIIFILNAIFDIIEQRYLSLLDFSEFENTTESTQKRTKKSSDTVTEQQIKESVKKLKNAFK